MRALVVYESMFGNTHVIADHIATGLSSRFDTTAVGVHDASVEFVESADVVVVGGPTHVHGMSSERSRDGAREMAAKDDGLHLDPDAEGPGLRDWFDLLPEHLHGRAAAFDTRVHATTLVTGQASKGIAKRLRRHGFELLVEPESFFVDRSNHLEPDEAARAEAWGRSVAEAAATQSVD
jgi:Flavodoxin